MTVYDYDVVVVGAGPGGYVAAIAAAKEGKKTCVVERARFGGVCLNEGCIPTKTLIKSVNVLHEIKNADEFGITGIDPAAVSISMDKVQKRKKRVVQKLVGGVKALLRGNKVAIEEGAASFVDAHTIAVGDKKITSEHFIIATGSAAAMPSFIKREGVNTILTSKEALELDAVPTSVVVIGGGVVGVEFAYLFNKLGGKVTVLELMDAILPMVDEDVSNMAKKRLEKDGVVFHMGARVHTIQNNTVLFEKNGKQESVAAECVLMAVGRTPNAEGLNAEAIGVAFECGAIKTDGDLKTSVPNIFAVGDVNGKIMLAHTASHEALAAVNVICGNRAHIDYAKIPSCIYLEPEVACIGLTEKQAKEQRAVVKTGKFPLAANGKSLVEGDTDGMIKVVVDGETEEILGAHLYGKHATDMIAELAAAMTLEATPQEIIQTVHPHPTVSEAVPEAFMAIFGKAVHCM